MHDATFGSIRERSTNFDQDSVNVLGGKVVVLTKTIGERPTFHVLHHEENRVASAPNPVDWDNVRVLERGGNARFALEPLDKGGVERQRSWENFNGDVAIQGALASAEDDGHSAAAKFLEDVVFVRQCCPNKFRIVGL
jgi:hypothetical protein